MGVSPSLSRNNPARDIANADYFFERALHNELTLAIRSCSLPGDEAMSKAPVIIMSGVVSNETMRRCQKLGARFIEKNSGFWHTLRPMICARRHVRLEGHSKCDSR